MTAAEVAAALGRHPKCQALLRLYGERHPDVGWTLDLNDERVVGLLLLGLIRDVNCIDIGGGDDWVSIEVWPDGEDPPFDVDDEGARGIEDLGLMVGRALLEVWK